MDALRSLENKLKVATPLLGILSIGFIADSYAKLLDSEAYALAIVIIAFMLSSILLILIFLKCLPASEMFRKIDMIVHLVIAVLLVIGWGLFVKNTADYTLSTKLTAERGAALVFEAVNIGIYAYIAVIIFKKR